MISLNFKQLILNPIDCINADNTNINQVIWEIAGYLHYKLFLKYLEIALSWTKDIKPMIEITGSRALYIPSTEF